MGGINSGEIVHEKNSSVTAGGRVGSGSKKFRERRQRRGQNRRSVERTKKKNDKRSGNGGHCLSVDRLHTKLPRARVCVCGYIYIYECVLTLAYGIHGVGPVVTAVAKSLPAKNEHRILMMELTLN